MNPFVEGTRLTPTDHQYNEIISDVLENGNLKGDRTGTGTVAVVGRLARYSLLNKRSPRPTTKKVTDNPEREMLWFRNGSSSIKELRDQKIGIWNSWLMEGSAQYRDMTQAEIQAALVKHLNVTDFTPVQNPSLPSGAFNVAIDEDDAERAVFEYSDELSWALAYQRLLNRLPVFLVDGDIGPGGYGPQWRHWKDTQVVRACEMEAYMAQGYKRIGVIDPVVDIQGEEAIKKALEEHFLAKGYKYASIGSADPVMVPACGYEMVGDREHGVHVLYLNEEALTKAYMVALDVPRIVMHREIDQLANAVNLLRTQPDSRRIIVSAWNPALIWKAALPPCHLYFQFISHELTLAQRVAIAQDRVELAKYDKAQLEARSGLATTEFITWTNWTHYQAQTMVSDEEMHRRLDEAGIKRRGLYCFLLLRSNDLGLGQPFNVAQYATLTHMVAQVTGMEALELVWTAVDAHVYANHVDALKHQLTLESKHCIPRIELNPQILELDDFTIDDIKIKDYESHSALTSHMPPAV